MSINLGAVSRPVYKDVDRTFLSVESASSKRFMTGQAPGQGLYWTPKGKDPEIAFMAVHYAADFSEHYLAGPMATRGFGFLGFGTRYRQMEENFVLEKALDDIAAGTKWLQENTSVKKLVLIGNSGGGSLLAAFQAKAEEDASIRGGDAFIFLNAHPGRADVLTMWLDPSVLDENDPTKRDPTLDMYNPENGPPYSKEFQERYREAQRQRNHRITAWVKDEKKRLADAGISERIFSVSRTWADLRFMDPTIDPSDRPSPTCYHGDPKQANNGLPMVGRASTLETWLSMWSLEDSKSRFEHQAASFTLPTLVLQSTADTGVFPSMAQGIYDSIGTQKKELKFIPGMHFFEDSNENLENAANVIVEWAKKTFEL